MILKQANKIANGIESKLRPFTNIINIAGSIRREKQDVKDIEIVCLPRYVPGAQTGLFSDIPPAQVISRNYVDTVLKLGKVVLGKPDGRYIRIELPQKINLDLFMPDPIDFFRQYAIRTGSSDYAHRTIAAGWLKRGWCGSDHGLRRISDCIEVIDKLSNKRSWKCVKLNGEKPPIWRSEKEFFDWIHVPFIIPKLRTI